MSLYILTYVLYTKGRKSWISTLSTRREEIPLSRSLFSVKFLPQYMCSGEDEEKKKEKNLQKGSKLRSSIGPTKNKATKTSNFLLYLTS